MSRIKTKDMKMVNAIRNCRMIKPNVSSTGDVMWGTAKEVPKDIKNKSKVTNK